MCLLCMLYVSSLSLILFLLDLPNPNVSIPSSSVTTGVAGDGLDLTCAMTVVKHLSEKAVVNITWSGGSVGQTGVTQSSIHSNSETVSIRNLTFSPLNTFHGDMYSCTAVIDIPVLQVTKNGVDFTDLKVQSKKQLI